MERKRQCILNILRFRLLLLEHPITYFIDSSLGRKEEQRGVTVLWCGSVKIDKIIQN